MADDFFSAVPFNGAASSVEPIDSFAQAIAHRFGSGDLLTARLVNDPPRSPPTTTTPALPLHLPNAPLANLSIAPHPSLSATPSASFASISPPSLTNYISDPSNLIVDIRPHAAHSSARVFRAVSLSVPSTLLKRPLFSLEKLCAMLPSRSSRSRFSHWQSAARIIVYDADSSAIPDNSNVCGLLKKFKNEGFAGDLAWIRGGFQAVWKERRDLITTDPPSPEEDDDESSKSSIAPALRTKHLPKSAFSLSTTTSSSAKSSAPRQSHRPAANPFFDTIRQNVELSQGITERIPLRLSRRVRKRIHDLPFPWLQQIARRAAARPSQFESGSESSDDLADNDADQAGVEEGAETLAMQFYRIELAEQRRLLTVMEHHSRESGVSSQQQDVGFLPLSATFPFSITAGVEKGTKNRYTHIWPFEHARVRLHSRKLKRNIDEDDYVNASYVQPLGTCKRYIATQGPLPATFVDFWTLCWEQNVHVIVMLTREVENAMVKCGTYWTDTAYGPLRLRLVSSSPAQSPAADATDVTDTNRGFFFALREPTPLHSAFPASGTGGSASKPKGHTTIKRVFELTHTAYPAVPPRRVTHLQYLEWPDMNVPDDPRGVLALMKEVAAAVEASSPGPSPGSSPGGLANISEETAVGLDAKSGIAKFALGKKSPVLLHCSAGVGRTGGFIAVDAVLDAIRGEVKKMRTGKLSREAAKRSEESMDVDELEDVSTVPSEQGLTEARSQILGTVPLHVSAGDGKKRRTRASGRDAEEGLVVHVPFAGWGDSVKTHGDAAKEGDEMNVDGSPDQVDLHASGAGAAWGSNPSTREWAERVSDQTGLGGTFETHGSGCASGSTSDLSLPLGQQASAKPVPSTIRSRRMSPPHASYQTVSRLGLLSLSPPRRVHSPPHYPLSLSQLPTLPRVEKTGSPSSSSNPSALNSADDSIGSGSAGGSASGSGSGVASASASGSGLGSAAGSGSGLGSGSRSGLGSGSGKVSASGRSASSIGVPPSSISASNSGSGGGSISASISGSGSTSNSGFNSGTGSGSMSGSGVMGLLRSRMRDSSATSLSNMSGSSGEARVHNKVPAQAPVVPREPSAIRIGHDASAGLGMKGYFGENVGMDVDGDRPLRSFSGPLGHSNEEQSGDMGPLAQTAHSAHHQHPHRIGASPMASLSTPMLAAPVVPGGVSFFLNRERAEMSAPMSRSASKSSSDSNLSSHPVSTPLSNVQTGSDRLSSLASPPPPSSAPLSQQSSVPPSRESPLVMAPSGLENGSAVDSGEQNPESSGQMSVQTANSSSSGDADKSANENSSGVSSGKAEVSNNTTSSTVKLAGEDATGTSLSDPSKLSLKLKADVIKEQPEPSIEATPQKEEAPTNEPSPPEGDRRAEGHSVIDYKLPRALHSDLSPPLLSSFDDPIWTVVQDMREQRMSLCQSLRQYVFVHAAVIEGALIIMDEEREMWGSGSEGSPGTSVGGSEERRPDAGDIPGRGAYFPAGSITEISAVGKSDSYQDRTQSVSGFFSGGMVSAASSVSGGGGGGKKGAPASVSSSSGLSSSPSKGKRVASPTELLKEDKSGEVSLAKRPSIKRKPGSSDGKLLTFDNSAELAAGVLGGASGVSRATPGSGGSVVKSTTTTGGPMAPERESGPSGIAR